MEKKQIKSCRLYMAQEEGQGAEVLKENLTANKQTLIKKKKQEN